MAFDLNNFIADITKDSGVDPQTLVSLLNNPTIAKRLEESTLRQSDYSSKVSEYQKKITAAQDYWDGLVQWDKKAKAELDAEKARIRGTEGYVPENNTVDNKNVMKQEDLQKLAQEALAYNNAITKISMQHYREFNEVLDPNDLLKVSQENGGINIYLAYDKYVQPKRDDLSKKQMDEAILKAREEGKAEALANFKLPTNENPLGVANTQLDNLSKKAEERAGYGSMAAIKAWQENRAKGLPIANF